MRSMSMLKVFLVGGAIAAGTFAAEREARACGGFFCSQSAPVNQAAERIIFADNGNGTVTAVIQILYEGPSENFSWLLPISTVPKAGEGIAIASNLAFTRLQTATNPAYSLTTRVEGTCAGFERGADGPPSASGAGGAASGPTANPGGGVTVAASGVVGAFEWKVIALDASLEDPSDAAVDWLETNGYDVAPGARGLLRPYLQDGLYLLALRLTKGADSGSIRPIALTYDASEPMIPIKLTAVAANEDMGVMTWLLSSARGVPRNYLSLELNEAKINWFNASSNYNDVVTAAADEAGGQGFVTEFAGESTVLDQRIWTPADESQWNYLKTNVFGSFGEIFDYSFNIWGTWDGYWDAVRATVTLPSTVTFEDFKACPNCYRDQVEFSPSALIAILEKDVIEPVRMVQELVDAHPYVTRLYTTMSASEMTADPLFTFNPDLEPVSNVHVAERVIECNPSVQQFEAPWRIELPQGGVIRGRGPQTGTWPDAVAEQPSNARIVRLSAKGGGAVLEDNAGVIEQMLDDYNQTVSGSPGEAGAPATGGTPNVGNGGSGNATANAGMPPTGGKSAGVPSFGGALANGASAGNSDGETPPKSSARDGGCSVPVGPSGSAGWFALALGLFAVGRRSRTRPQ